MPAGRPAVHISIRSRTDGPDGPAEYAAEDPESWEITGGIQPVDLGFLRNLPAGSITGLHLRSLIVPESFPAVAHLAPGLRRLCLARSDLTDDALPTVAALRGLVYLQSWGNRFTGTGVQQLASLTRLESLYLEEETLSAAAFDFAASLPQLARLGLQDVPLSAAELTELRQLAWVLRPYVQPHPVDPKMTKIGPDLWSIQINITHQMRHHKFWTLGVKASTTLHLIHIQL